MQQRPLGVCNTCGNYAFRQYEINQPCQAQHQGQACTGRVKDASAESDWDKCPACNQSGSDPMIDCPQCAGAGWLPL